MKILKSFIIALLFLLSANTYSQKKEFLILDSSSNLPVPDVNVYYPNIQEGTFTNSDGKAIINIKDYDLKISNINYEDKLIKSTDVSKSDTIYLNLKTTLIDEVVIKSFNLPKALNYVVENYDNLYENNPFEKECVFKETLNVNGNLKRLILSKVNWWGKSYKVKYMDDLKLRLGSIDFNKNEPMNIFTDSEKENTPSKSGYIATSNLISILYLNTVLDNFLKISVGLHSAVEESPSDEIIVSYQTDWAKLKNGSEKTHGKITFDKLTKAIISLSIIVDKKDEVVKGTTSISKKNYSVENTASMSNYTFIKGLNNKLTLNSLEAVADVSMIYDNKNFKISVANNIFVLKESAVKKVSNAGIIDLSKPIFESLPSSEITSANSILLSKDEKSFIYGK